MMQDAPFLVLRMLLIFKYGVLSYTNMFFTCKNTLVCMLLSYRLIVIQLERCNARYGLYGSVPTPKPQQHCQDLITINQISSPPPRYRNHYPDFNTIAKTSSPPTRFQHHRRDIITITQTSTP